MSARYNGALREATLRDPGTAALDVEANSYSTTIGLIISGLIKLGRIASAPRDAEGTAVAFRGIAGLELPPAVFTPDKRGFCGVVEPGFLSLSDDEAVAAKYRCTYIHTHAHSLAFSLSLCFFLSLSVSFSLALKKIRTHTQRDGGQQIGHHFRAGAGQSLARRRALMAVAVSPR
jgi:hypothetical protein